MDAPSRSRSLAARGPRHPAAEYASSRSPCSFRAPPRPTDTVSRLVATWMTRTSVRSCSSKRRRRRRHPGTARAARAEPDGYTLRLNHVAQATQRLAVSEALL